MPNPEGHVADAEAPSNLARGIQRPEISAASDDLPVAPVKETEMIDQLAKAKKLTREFDAILARMKELLNRHQVLPPKLEPLRRLYDDLPPIEDEFNELVKKIDQLADFGRNMIRNFARVASIQDGDTAQITARLRRNILAYDKGMEKVKVRFEISKIRMRIIETKIRKCVYV